MSLSVHVNNKKSDILIHGIGLTQGLDNTTLISEGKHSFNFPQSNRTFCLCFGYNGSKNFLFVDATKQFNSKKNILVFRKCFGRFFIQ